MIARLEGKGALQPVNATSHRLNGERAASGERADLVHTRVGFATHAAATLFWAVLFEHWIVRRHSLAVLPALQDAMVLSVAAAADYIATPKRFTPGSQFVLSKRGMAAVYGAMARGLAGGAVLARDEQAAAATVSAEGSARS